MCLKEQMFSRQSLKIPCTCINSWSGKNLCYVLTNGMNLLKLSHPAIEPAIV